MCLCLSICVWRSTDNWTSDGAAIRSRLEAPITSSSLRSFNCLPRPDCFLAHGQARIKSQEKKQMLPDTAYFAPRPGHCTLQLLGDFNGTILAPFLIYPERFMQQFPRNLAKLYS